MREKEKLLWKKLLRSWKNYDHILESMMMVQLVAALNDEFDIEITPRDIVPENFQSAKAINEMVERLLEDE